MNRKTALSYAALTALVLSSAPAAHAGGRANPQQGYTSTLQQLVNKGVTHGRCNAVGIHAEQILLTGNALPVPVPAWVATSCVEKGVFLSPDIVEGGEELPE